jgi:transposase
MEKSLAKHYAKLLGLEKPWVVADVQLDLEDMRVEIALEHPNGEGVTCPCCGEGCPIADRGAERKWRHLDTMQFSTELVARVPRADCPGCGVKTVAVPWAQKGSRFTLMFEAFAIGVIDASSSIKKAAALLGMGWDAVHRIMERAVQRGVGRRGELEIERVGMDEKSFRKGHRYISLLNDLDGGRVLEVVEGRKEAAADALWESLGEAGRASVKAVAIDMWEAFINSAEKRVPGAAIVHDRYHIAAHLGRAVDQIRRAENKRLRAGDDDILKGTRQLWLTGMENLGEKRWLQMRELLHSDLRTAEAWMLKENMRWLWEYTYAGNARKFFGKWYEQAIDYGEAPIVKVAEMINRHLDNILTYFRHRITNAVSEGLNSKIQSIKAMARGFHGFKNYRTRILFFCGKLDMSPFPNIDTQPIPTH